MAEKQSGQQGKGNQSGRSGTKGGRQKNEERVGSTSSDRSGK
jgi:hypothetical protein